ALLPQWRALPRPAAWDQQRAHGALAEAAGEQRRVADGPDDDVFDLLRLEHDHVGRGRLVGFRQTHDDTVVGVQALHVDTEPLAHARFHGLGLRRVDASAEWRGEAQAQIAVVVTGR